MALLLNFRKPKNQLEEGGRKEAPVSGDAGEPEKVGPNCRKRTPAGELRGNRMVCSCGYHFHMPARQHIHLVADEGSFTELAAGYRAVDPLYFPGYREKLDAARAASGEEEGVICGTAEIRGKKTAVFSMEAQFMMGSMGTVVGEKITMLFEYATEHRLPVVGFLVSGGARMQEGLLSLMQMAKTSAAVKQHSDAGLLYIAVLTDPTTGGVTASFGMEADIILAEPGATIGFAGQRVIEQTTRKALPRGFQKAEFVQKHGFVDRVVSRDRQRILLAALLAIHESR